MAIAPNSLSITIWNLWAKWFPKVPLTEEQLAVCTREWSECRSIPDVFNALKIVRKKQRGPAADRLRVEDGDDLADAIRVYATAVLQNAGKLPKKPEYKPSYPTLAEIIAGGGYGQQEGD